MLRAGVISLHTSPLTQAGSGDSGGMNVYIREFVSSLTQAGVACDVFVRRWAGELAEIVEVEPGFRVIHVPAGPVEMAKEDLPEIVDEFTEWMRGWLSENPVDVLHANYWLSGVVGHRLKHRLDLPLVTTFHTLARVKAETGDAEPGTRVEAETKVVACSDVLVANADEERRQLIELYGADPDRVEIVAPGVDRALFSPGSSEGAKAAIGYEGGPLVLFVGRIQPLKGVDIAVRALVQLTDPTAKLMIVGGASGRKGDTEVSRIMTLISDLDLTDRVMFVEPQPHYALSTYYRAADVLVMPSRSESFGLVALEAAACGVPVVAAAVGGLRTLVQDGVTGYLIEARDPSDYASAVDRILGDPSHASALGAAAAIKASRYPWSGLAIRLRRIYSELVEANALVDCS
ncbi:MAG: D-inositol-3-phosphate glycosyltransferase [Verrucomicrobiales bacterium]